MTDKLISLLRLPFDRLDPIFYQHFPKMKADNNNGDDDDDDEVREIAKIMKMMIKLGRLQK